MADKWRGGNLVHLYAVKEHSAQKGQVAIYRARASLLFQARCFEFLNFIRGNFIQRFRSEPWLEILQTGLVSVNRIWPQLRLTLEERFRELRELGRCFYFEDS